MANPKIFAWNCGGLRDSTAKTRSKVMFFEKEFKNKFDIFFFLETHHKSKAEIPKEILRYENTHHIIHSATTDSETHTGIIGLIRNDYDLVSTKDVIQGRILNIRIEHRTEKTNFNLTAVYFDTNRNMNKDKMLNIVRKLRFKIENGSNNIILGDFNFIDYEKDKAGGLSSTDKAVNKIWSPFLDEMDMVDPFREQNPKRRVWSFIGSGAAWNSRIDRVYVNSINMKNITNIKYIQTPYGGHRILSFTFNNTNDRGKSYYKMNTSILSDAKYRAIVDETLNELDGLGKENEIEKWEIFLMTIKSKSIYYSQIKNKAKRSLKDEIIRKIFKIENGKREDIDEDHYAYLKGKLKEIEEREIEGYVRRVRYLAEYEKGEPDIAFYSKLEEQKIAGDRIGQLAETEKGPIYTDKGNILRIATKFYTDLYTPQKVNIKTQEKLLRNITKKITPAEKDKLDAPITEDEIKTAVYQLKRNSN